MWLVIGLLVTHVIGMMTAVRYAMGDRTFIALPDYYGKSIRWDKTRETARRSEALGWTRTISVSPADAKGERVISIRITDKAHVAIAGLKAIATVYPELFPNQSQDVLFNDHGDGTYSVRYTKTAHGPLVVDFSATKADQTFVTRSTLMVGGGT